MGPCCLGCGSKSAKYVFLANTWMARQRYMFYTLMSHLARKETLKLEFCLPLQVFTCHQSTKGDDAVGEHLSTSISCSLQSIIIYPWEKGSEFLTTGTSK